MLGREKHVSQYSIAFPHKDTSTADIHHGAYESSLVPLDKSTAISCLRSIADPARALWFPPSRHYQRWRHD